MRYRAPNLGCGMLSDEEALAKLPAWIHEPISVIIVPDFEGAMQVAGMAGVLRRDTAPLGVAEITGQTDEVLFFFVGEEEDWQRRFFVLTRPHFVRAFSCTRARSVERCW